MGLDIAQGEYIGFVDSDDWIVPDMFEKLYEQMKEASADISICGYYIVSENGDIINKNIQTGKNVLSSKEALDKIMNPGGYYGYLCNKLFSTKLFTNNTIRLPEDIYICEDLLCVIKCMEKSKLVVYDSKPKYYYRQCEKSAPPDISKAYIEKQMTLSTAIKRIIENAEKDSKLCNDAECMLVNVNITSLYVYLQLQNPDKKIVNDMIADIDKYIHKYKLSLKLRIYYLLICISPNFYYSVLKLLKKLKSRRNI